MNGGTTFKCTFCEHSVTTLDFDSASGNRRIQAAAVINQHAALLLTSQRGRPLHDTAAAHQINDQNHQRYYQQQVDQTAGHVQAET
jgi:hypothetical protein